MGLCELLMGCVMHDLLSLRARICRQPDEIVGWKLEWSWCDGRKLTEALVEP
jgi:hypothetical protein